MVAIIEIIKKIIESNLTLFIRFLKSFLKADVRNDNSLISLYNLLISILRACSKINVNFYGVITRLHFSIPSSL